MMHKRLARTTELPKCRLQLHDGPIDVCVRLKEYQHFDDEIPGEDSADGTFLNLSRKDAEAIQREELLQGATPENAYKGNPTELVLEGRKAKILITASDGMGPTAKFEVVAFTPDRTAGA